MYVTTSRWSSSLVSSYPRSAGPYFSPSICRLLIVFLTCTLASTAGILLGRNHAQAAVIWPANGVLLGLMLQVHRRRWPSYLLCGVFVSMVLHAYFGFPNWMSAVFAIANTAEVLIAALLITAQQNRRSDLSFPRTLGRFLLLGVLIAPLSSSLAVFAGEWLVGHPTGFVGIRDWYLGDAIGLAVTTPLMLAIRPRELLHALQPGRRLETAFLMVGIITMSVIVFHQYRYPTEFLLLPYLLVIIFRLGATGGALGIVLMAGPGAYFTMQARGPFSPVDAASLGHSIRLFQFYLCILIATVYIVASVLAEKQRLQDALAASNLQLGRIAASDPLTLLPNRRALDERLDQEWRRAIREKSCISLLMVDVDNFKAYNDRYGHVAGDALLMAIAGVLSNAAKRAADFAARYGGEEFAIALPATESSMAVVIAERLREAVAALPQTDENGELTPVTVSIGIATIWPHKDANQTFLIEAADRALYVAKNAGRNQVSVAHPIATAAE